MQTALTPDSVSHCDQRVTYDWFSKALLFVQIGTAIFLEKVAAPKFGDTQLFLEFFVITAITAIGFIAGRLEVNFMRFALFLLMAGGFSLLQFAAAQDISLSSLILLIAFHIPYIFALKLGTVRPGTEIRFFQGIMTLLAILGIMQFLLQFVIGWRYAFFVDTQLPKQILMSGYNSLNPIKQGLNVYKSNGVFMLEPAMFCQFLAIGIVIEMAYYRRIMQMLLFTGAIATTFSGTGLVILGILVPTYLILNRKFSLLIVIALMLTAVISFAPMLGLDLYVSRVNEFASTRSSGYARFIAVFPTIYNFILPQANTLLFGLGAGSSKTVAMHVNYEIHLPSWGKVLVEYGSVGLALYLPLMTYVLFSPKRNGYIKAALAIQFFFDAYLLVPTVHGIIIGLLAWPDKNEYVPGDPKSPSPLKEVSPTLHLKRI